MTGHLIITATIRATASQPISLESRVGVGQELLEVGLEPGTGLGGGLQGVGLPAVEVVPGGALVAGAVRLTAGLDPDEGVLELKARVGGGAEAETSSPGCSCQSTISEQSSCFDGSTYKALHQSPHAAWPVGCLPERPWSVMKCASNPSALRRGAIAWT